MNEPLDDPLQNFHDFFEFYSNEPDSVTAILVPAKLDALLRICIERRLLPAKKPKDDTLLRSDGALGTFSSRIEIAYRLGIVDSDYKVALHLLRKMRNEFAHGFETQDFASQHHKSRILELVRPIEHTRFYLDAFARISDIQGEERANYLIVTAPMTSVLTIYATMVKRIDGDLLPALSFLPDN